MESEKTAMYQNYSNYCTAGQTVLKDNERNIFYFIDRMIQDRETTDVITLVDFGTADGGNALPVLNSMIGYLQRMNPPCRHINLIFEDHGNNDFNGLANTIIGNRKGLRQPSYVHAFMCPISMYEQVVPDATIDLGIATYCVHWLSDWSMQIKNGIFSCDANAAELKIIKSQAKKDWRLFVLNRGRELKPGGFIFVSTLSAGKTDVYNLMTLVYREMVKDGIITMKEFKDTNAEWFVERTEEDLMLPFMNNDDLEISRLNLKLVSYKEEVREFFPVDPSNSTDKDTALRAKGMTDLVKGWSYNIFHRGLSKDRSEMERSGIIDGYFERLRMKFVLENKSFRYTSPMADIIFMKE